jgi:hypothetical protein
LQLPLLPLLQLPSLLSCHPSPQAEDLLLSFQIFHKKIQIPWRVFTRRKTTINPPRFTTQFTTNSPQKTIHKTPLFLKHPSKMPIKTAKPRVSPGLHFFAK